MTQKELLYLEDAITHEENLSKICEDYISKLEDEELQTFLKGQMKKHENLRQKLIKVMEDAQNE